MQQVRLAVKEAAAAEIDPAIEDRLGSRGGKNNRIAPLTRACMRVPTEFSSTRMFGPV